MERSCATAALWVMMHLIAAHWMLSAHHVRVVIMMLLMLSLHVVSSPAHIHVVLPPIMRRLELLLIVRVVERLLILLKSIASVLLWVVLVIEHFVSETVATLREGSLPTVHVLIVLHWAFALTIWKLLEVRGNLIKSYVLVIAFRFF